MFSRNLQIFLGKDDPDSMRMVRPADVLCLRLTRRSLEILVFHPNTGSNSVFVLRGRNLFLLWAEITGDGVHSLKPGSRGISSITEERGWTAATEPMFPDPNPVRPDCILVETSTTRDLWLHRYLEVFALRPGIGFLLQFRDQHAYVLAANVGVYATTRDELLRSNLDSGTTNSFSLHLTHDYPAGSVVTPYRFASIAHKHRDVASEGNWETVIDNRPGKAGPTIGFSP